jgi:spermidine synthase
MNSISDEAQLPSAAPHAWRISLVAFMLGLTSMATQVVLLREFISVFYGNELVIGVLLANWMALTGIGAFWGRRLKRFEHSLGFLTSAVLLIALLPGLTVTLLRFLRTIVFAIGTMVDPVSIAWSSFLLLMPYCLIAGSMFTFLASAGSRSGGSNAITSVYASEAVGSFAGGIIFSLLLAFVLNAAQVLTALFALNVMAALALAREMPRARILLWGGAILLLVPATLFDLDAVTRQFLFPGQHILFSRDSPYGNLTVTEQAGQTNFFENNVLFSSTHDIAGSEEPVHYAMAQRPSSKRVLMVSGASSGAPREVLKYGIERLEYVEVNPLAIEAARRFTSALNDSRITVINQDVRTFLRSTTAVYAAVLLNVPEPSTVQLNRVYTAEFFQSVKARMSPDAVLSLGLLPATDYQSDEARRMNSTLFNTLSLYFRNVLIVPGQRMYFLASDSVLDIRIGYLVGQCGIATTYVNQHYLDDGDLQRRSELIEGTLDPGAPVNRDFAPVSYYRHMVHWLSYFRSNIWIVGIMAAALIALVARQLNAVTAGLLSGGFAASCIEVLLLIAFQTLFGYVYQMLGIIITVFMGGLAFGAITRRWLIASVSFRGYMVIQIGMTLYSLLLAVFLWGLHSDLAPSLMTFVAFPLLTFVFAALVGLEFSTASCLRPGDPSAVASELYAVDLIGSALGALLVSTVLIPTIGLVGVCFVTGLMTFLTAVVALIKTKTIRATG